MDDVYFSNAPAVEQSGNHLGDQFDENTCHDSATPADDKCSEPLAAQETNTLRNSEEAVESGTMEGLAEVSCGREARGTPSQIDQAIGMY